MLEIISAKGALALKYNLKKGDKILAFDGYKAVDSLDYIYYDSRADFKLSVLSPDGVTREIDVKKGEDESLNLEFKPDEIIRTCRNSCIFCFVDQMKKGMRESLYVKDDDYTMSFMCGNFVTLTNLDDAELDRIIRLHLSPLYVSVHTMDGELRCKLLRNRFAGKIGEQLARLAAAGITVHCQAVIVPGLNDGKNLEYTAEKLFALYPSVVDLAVVPTGLTKYRDNLQYIEDIDENSAAEIIDLCDRLNSRFKVNFCQPADEYFIKSGRPFKPPEFYGDFSQIENGIGMTRKFVSDFNESLRPAKLKKSRKVAVVTGVSAAGIIQSLCMRANACVENLHAFALPVKNTFFGESVTCTGLLTGGDIIREVENCNEEIDSVIIPANTLKEFEDVFLDDVKLSALVKRLKGKKIIVNRLPQDFFESLLKG